MSKLELKLSISIILSMLMDSIYMIYTFHICITTTDAYRDQFLDLSSDWLMRTVNWLQYIVC